MFLAWLRCGFGQKHLAWLCGLGKSTISRYLRMIDHLVKLLVLLFGKYCHKLWPSKDQIVSLILA